MTKEDRSVSKDSYRYSHLATIIAHIIIFGVILWFCIELDDGYVNQKYNRWIGSLAVLCIFVHIGALWPILDSWNVKKVILKYEDDEEETGKWRN